MNRLKEAYVIESDLARRLRAAPKESRAAVAREVYAELYRRVSWHPDLNRSAEERSQRAQQARFAYERWIASATAVLEVGAGGCDLLAELGRDYPNTLFVGIDVARAPFDETAPEVPPNTRFLLAGAADIPFADGTFDFVYCSQVLEHFHPDDVPEHLAEVARVLRPGGCLGFDTPNRLTGPHDVSRGFTPEATGLHLKEWTYGELVALLRETGFDSIVARSLPGRIARALRLRPPGPLVAAGIKASLEAAVLGLPGRRLQQAAGRSLGLDGVYLYARKAAV